MSEKIKKGFAAALLGTLLFTGIGQTAEAAMTAAQKAALLAKARAKLAKKVEVSKEELAKSEEELAKSEEELAKATKARDYMKKASDFITGKIDLTKSDIEDILAYYNNGGIKYELETSDGTITEEGMNKILSTLKSELTSNRPTAHI